MGYNPNARPVWVLIEEVPEPVGSRRDSQGMIRCAKQKRQHTHHSTTGLRRQKHTTPTPLRQTHFFLYKTSPHDGVHDWPQRSHRVRSTEKGGDTMGSWSAVVERGRRKWREKQGHEGNTQNNTKTTQNDTQHRHTIFVQQHDVISIGSEP